MHPVLGALSSQARCKAQRVAALGGAGRGIAALGRQGMAALGGASPRWAEHRRVRRGDARQKPRWPVRRHFHN